MKSLPRRGPLLTLWDEPSILPTDALLARYHYLGAISGGTVYRDEHGLMVFDSPTSRNFPREGWLELTRWCITGNKNAGSKQWARARRWLLETHPDVTTVVSYSDPSAGHTGALYRACGWLRAPTWHILRPPPSGQGSWDGRTTQAVKDRWIAVLRPDHAREAVLELKDGTLRRRYPWAEYREPSWKRGRPHGGGGDYKRWQVSTTA